jgi:hypothetical protein
MAEDHLLRIPIKAGKKGVLFHRRGRDLQDAGVQFLTTGSATEREFTHVLLEATHVDRAKTLPVLFRWPALEAD